MKGLGGFGLPHVQDRSFPFQWSEKSPQPMVCNAAVKRSQELKRWILGKAHVCTPKVVT